MSEDSANWIYQTERSASVGGWIQSAANNPLFRIVIPKLLIAQKGGKITRTLFYKDGKQESPDIYNCSLY